MNSFIERFVSLFRKNIGKLWLAGFIIFAFIPNNPFFQNYFGTPVWFFITLYGLYLVGGEITKFIRRVSNARPLYLKGDWVTFVIVIVIYFYIFGGPPIPGEPGFQVTFKWFRLLIVALLWFNFGFRMGQRVRLPEVENSELLKKTD